MAVLLNAFNFNHHIVVGKHTNPFIASLAFKACNCELLSNTDLILLLKKAFSA